MRNGTLNVHALKFDPESLKGLLGDEPAADIEGEIVGVPEGENGMGVDVEDEQENKLVWDEDEKSGLILAGKKFEAADVAGASVKEGAAKREQKQEQPTEKASPKPKKTPARPKDGFGFSYSDSEDEDFAADATLIDIDESG